MKTSVNAPIGHYELNQSPIAYGLAHEALRSPVYLNQLKKSDKYLILDNGADELGAGLSGGELWSLFQDIDPEELILPDVLGDSKETIENSEKFFYDFVADNTEALKKNFMFVIQGQTFEEWSECFKYARDTKIANVIGVPYDIDFDVPGVEVEGNKSQLRAARRAKLVEFVVENGLKKPIHLLGFNNLQEFENYHKPEYKKILRSNDTTAPFAAAAEGIRLSDRPEGPKDWKPLDFDVQWERELDKDSTWQIAADNLVTYAEAAGDARMAYEVGKMMGVFYAVNR